MGGGWGVCRNGSELRRGDDGGTRSHGHVPAALKQKEDVQGPFRHAGGLPRKCRQAPRHLRRSFLLKIDKAPAFLGKVVCTPKHLALGWVGHLCQGLTPIFLHVQEFEVRLRLCDVSRFSLESIKCRASEGACLLFVRLSLVHLAGSRQGGVCSHRQITCDWGSPSF